jgi:hypothetical protein
MRRAVLYVAAGAVFGVAGMVAAATWYLRGVMR